MRINRALRALGPIDARNVGRDSLLAWILLLPVVLALFLRLTVPRLQALLVEQYAFDLTPYYPLLMSSFMVLAPSIAGMVVGFLLLDERDENLLLALMVTPLSLTGYVFYRLALPVVLGLVVTAVSYPIAQLVPLPWPAFLGVALLGALTAPLLALALAAFAENKVAGLAVMKALNGILLLPTLAYFVPEPWQWAAGLLPAYWPLKVFWQAAAGEPYGIYLVVGFLVSALYIAFFLRRYLANVYGKG